jgi:hypothetical protein
MSTAKKGVPKSDEHRANMSLAITELHARRRAAGEVAPGPRGRRSTKPVLTAEDRHGQAQALALYNTRKAKLTP